MFKRMLHDNICVSRKLSAISEGAENQYYRVYTKCDDAGRYYADPYIIKGHCYPFKEIPIKEIERRTKELADIGLIIIYRNREENYQAITRFEDFQTFRKDIKPKVIFPEPPSDRTLQAVATRNGPLQDVTTRNDPLLKDKLSKDKLSKPKVKEDLLSDSQEIISDTLTPKTLALLYNITCKSMPEVTKLTQKRLKKTRNRLKEENSKRYWEKVFKIIESTPFLKGIGKNTWTGATFDWVITNDTNYVAIYEGKYRDKKYSGAKAFLQEAKDKGEI